MIKLPTRNEIKVFTEQYHKSNVVIKYYDNISTPMLVVEHGFYSPDFLCGLKKLMGAKEIGISSDKFGIVFQFIMPMELF